MPAISMVIRFDGEYEKHFLFNSVIHTAKSAGDLLLDRDFYIQNGPGLPECEHHELELTDERIWNHRFHPLIHFRTSKLNGRKFICFPSRISSIKDVIKIFITWTVGTTFTMTHGRDFQEVYKNDMDTFLKVMKERYSIEYTGNIKLSMNV